MQPHGRELPNGPITFNKPEGGIMRKLIELLQPHSVRDYISLGLMSVMMIGMAGYVVACTITKLGVIH